MKTLANENFPAPSTRLLRNAGWDVKSIKEEMSAILAWGVPSYF